MRISIALLAFLLSACGAADRGIATMSGYSQTCIKGVVYYQFTSGAAIGVDQAGRVLTCK